MSASEVQTITEAVSTAGAGERELSRPAGTSQKPSRPRGRLRYASWWWVVPAVVLMLGIQYTGIAVGSVYAFTDWRGLGDFHFVGISNFQQIFATPATLTALINTVVLAVSFLILTNVLGLAFAVALNRTIKSRDVLRVLMFMPVVLSSLAVSYIWKFIFQQQGPLNGLLNAVGLHSWTTAWLGNPSTAIWTILVVMVWQHVGLAMVIYLAGLANVPAELEEAAAVDGAGAWTRFIRIVLPQLRPTVLIVSTLIMIQGLRVFDQVIATTNGGPFGATETLATLGYKETFVNGRYGYGAAISLVLTVLILVIAVIQVTVLRERKDA